jgi:hypothetical protein
VSLPKQHAAYDEHRNSSRVWPVTPQDGENARRTLAAFKRDYPELHAWIVEGAPTLTEAEHVARFGEPYNGVRSKHVR